MPKPVAGQPETDKEKEEKETESRKFDIVSEISSLKGLVEVLIARSKEERPIDFPVEEIVGVIDKLPDRIGMAECSHYTHKLSFAGRGDEDVDELIRKLDILKLAHKWTNDQLMGHALYCLSGDSLAWFEQETNTDANVFKTDDKYDYDKFSKAIKERFKKDKTKADLYLEVLAMKQKRSQSVDDFLSEMMPKLVKLKDTTEEFKVSILINAFLPVVADHIKLVQPKTLNDVELWSKRISNMSFANRSNVVLATDDSSELETVNVVKASNEKQKSKSIECFGCGGNHVVKNCPSKLRQGSQRQRQHNTNIQRGNRSQRQYNAPSQQMWQGRQAFNNPGQFNRNAQQYRPQFRPQFIASRGTLATLHAT